MPKHVLVPIDGSDHAFAGLEYCFASFPDVTTTALYVVDPEHDHEATAGGPDSADERAEAYAQRVLEQATEYAADYDCQMQTSRRTGTPHTEILGLTNTDVDHVVMGSHGESPISRPFLGRVSEAVVRRAPVSTTIVPESRAAIQDRDLPGDVLVPMDRSEQARAALSFALEAFPEANYTVLHALSLPFDRPREEVEGTYLVDILDEREARAAAVFETARAVTDEYDATIETATGNEAPAKAIVDTAVNDEFDQIVMGSHGRSLAARLVTGTVAERVARRSPRTVTLVRGDPTS
ncbi:universal stress protein [Salinadaptatus halalkaliphilus]|uniref:Universal stress protein n=1 Tax=Salinadaptatus halalkaliphilus TaxID=2419781 RepID=A0A4S3TV00_9EURY|nr:universal stress protein [Salinadaptatus halalkaliphilus]THE66508.1 universal stress protein [Salinadaptatus halalkaliphilus]